METIRLKNKSLVVGDSEMANVLKDATRAATTSHPVLLCGESGTGKELIARYIHERSERASRPFIAVNCAAIPEGLMEAELFGFEKGAFTGALFQRIGKFELASGGTLLLDELSEMPFPLQAKLLRVLQEGEIDRLGAREPVRIDVRIIATSNKIPERLIAEGKFREDLYYRLNVIRLNCPALLGRNQAIENLTHFFLKSVGISAEAMDKLRTHLWPGNVRELENVIERAILKGDGGCIFPEAISFERLRVERNGPQGGRTLAEVERESILSALDSKGGNRTYAAKELGISVRTLRNKLKEYRQE